MAADFQILNPPHTPVWRSPPRARPRRGSIVLGALSLLTVLLATWPGPNGFREPLSLQFARGETITRIMFCDMAVILACTLYRMMKFNRRVCAAFCGFSLVGLLGIALTNPLSGFHLVIFLHTLLLSLVWMWWVHREFPEGSLFWSALLGTVGGLICFVSIGVGERMFMLGTLAAINALVYEYLSPQLTRGHS